MRKINYKEKGITLIALVITVIILLILAGVTLTTALGQNGLFQRAKDAGEKYKESEADEAEKLGEVEKEIDKIIDGKDSKKVEKGPNGKPLLKTVTSTNHNTETYEDSLGNPVVIPGGFKFAGNTDDTVQDGIIIKDDEENEFVWIPVSNIDGDNDATTQPDAEDLIVLKDNKKVEITLGRYTFAKSDNNGKETLVQKGSDYSTDTVLEFMYGNYYEYASDKRVLGGKGAKDLAGFVQSVEENHGYYLARYEASYKSDDEPYSKPSTSCSRVGIDYTSGMLWNCITQEEAAKISQNMYSEGKNEGKYVESDLVNSYAWDTAIVYIQAMGNENYANASRGTAGNATSLLNTGESSDVKCNIYDMAANVREWTTEYSDDIGSDEAYPCVARGDDYVINFEFATVYRQTYMETDECSFLGFRPLLYLKEC